MMLFIGISMRNPSRIGAIAPSSTELARAMINNVELRPGEGVIELGPGSGAFTAQIRKVIPDAAAYLGIERERVFVELLKNVYPDLTFITGEAEQAAEIYKKTTSLPVKAIICGLPFANMKKSVQDCIIDNIEMLMAPGCVFRTFQYAHAWPLPTAIRFRQKMTELFGPVHRGKVLFGNIPPALVLSWSRSDHEVVSLGSVAVGGNSFENKQDSGTNLRSETI
jgi:phospholipid N-methyltransferase